MSLSFAQAQTLLHSSFIVHTSVGTVELRLIEATEIARPGLPAEYRTPMLLVFSAPASPILAQDNYYFDHPNIGRHFWSVAPVLAPASRPITVNNEPLSFYQVLFN
ncbi:DUF6916 family protein [Undibacterium macrobrachii]|uniref:DUF6916 domain-containing protein n=1 Tax=Undibacterium macrobrachii TaxID=1119058 RepID=A0ABQ2XH04_9BURK|nr:hypothetical protein [Undibacterium macrobrachii]GGX16607.1 hypothetical protein GCM10011282_23810 [Undibacterium macrobrachii]